MKKIFVSCFALASMLTAKAQSYNGFFNDNYAGVHGVLFNPASIVDSRFSLDVNLFSASSSVTNDYAAVKISDLFKSSYNFKEDSKTFASNNNNAIVNTDVMGPSFMFSLAPKHAIAVYTRARVYANAAGINGYLVDQLDRDFNFNNDFYLNTGDFTGVGHAWGEIGASYAAVLLQNKQHFLKGGLTAKFLLGGFNTYVNGENTTFSYVVNTTDPTQNTATTTGTVTYGGSEGYETFTKGYKANGNSKGAGFDLGFIYEWRPDYANYDISKVNATTYSFQDQNKYKLRFGLSVTDIGSIKYNEASEATYTINGSTTDAVFESGKSIYEILNTQPGFQRISDKGGQNISLPTALHANADWNMYKKFYLNLNGDFNLINRTTIYGNSIANTVLLTPRYETKWFSAYIPVGWRDYSGVQVGSGLRYGPVFVGSSSIISNLVSNESKAADIHFGVKFPLYYEELKDKDFDGVVDKKDACPDVAGPVENKGCPWPDTDGDTVLDKDDACVSVAGPVENKGCPWPDTDADTILDKDDACPAIAGPVENKGCPWPDTDGDTVLDKDDACVDVPGLVEFKGCPKPFLDADKDGVEDKEDNCPTVFGPASNKGCPEVTPMALEDLKIQARAVYFNTGKATFKKGGVPAALNAISEILKNYPNAKFSIEGHTDNVGSAKVNKKLSQARADVIRKALIKRGVKAENLEAKGYGPSRPVGDNKTKAGRAANRRTEIVHVGTVYQGKL